VGHMPAATESHHRIEEDPEQHDFQPAIHYFS
jgi:hypothetical protein